MDEALQQTVCTVSVSSLVTSSLVLGKMRLPASVKAINLGCGVSVAPGWTNIDNSPNARLSKYPMLRWLFWKAGVLSDQHYAVKWPKATIVRDLRKRLPFMECSIDYAYSSHVLEHLALDEAHMLIREVLRVLKPGGILRLVVPDLAYGARCYLAALANNLSSANAAPEFLNWLQLARPGDRDPHLWMYDGHSLSTMLTEAGFANPVVCEYRRGRLPDCDVLDTRPGESVHIEAEKP